MIPPELQQMISQVRQQYPQLAHLSDEQVAALIVQTMEQQVSTNDQDNGFDVGKRTWLER